jgi:carbonic anhydrase
MTITDGGATPGHVSRRTFVWTAGLLLAGLGTATARRGVAAAAAPVTAPGVSADQALQRLLKGNERFRTGRPARPNQTARRRGDLTTGQQPFAAILSCSDSRVPPEVVFDQGLGDLFVVRVAGNVADDPEIGSLEYAAAVLGTPLLLVLGHEQCGAVEAALKGDPGPGHVGTLTRAILPAVEKIQRAPGDLLDNAGRANVARVVDQLRAMPPILSDAVQGGRLKVLGGYYQLGSGAVQLIA